MVPFGVQHYDYGDVEIASEVGWDAYKSVADGLMIMLEKTGLLHGYSFNSWSDVVTYDRNFVEEWLLSPQTSLYYSLQVMGDVQDKSDAYAALDDGDVEEYLQDILGKRANNLRLSRIMRKHPYQKLIDRKRTWTPVKPTKGVYKEGADETIKTCPRNTSYGVTSWRLHT